MQPNGIRTGFKSMPAHEWGSRLSMVDASLNPVPRCDLDEEMLKELLAEKCALAFQEEIQMFFGHRYDWFLDHRYEC